MATCAGEEAGAGAAVTITSLAASGISLGYVCPRCRSTLAESAASYACCRCGSTFPVVMGIPDLRVAADPWIGLEEDRDKARRLVAATRGASLESMVRAYWAMTSGTTAAQAERFIAHVLSATGRSAEWLDRIGRAPADHAGAWLDVGTGTGDLATAVATRGLAVTGIDVAMRWLVVAKRRAELAGVNVRLVCCNAEHLPFPDARFARVVSLGTLEHCTDAAQALAEARRVLPRGGDVRLRTVNRYSVLPEPHVGVWGVGYLPRRLADRYVRWRTGRQYEHHRPLSPREVARALTRAGFRDARVEAAPLLTAERARLGRAAWMGRLYDAARQVPPVRPMLRWTAPLLEASGVAA